MNSKLNKSIARILARNGRPATLTWVSNGLKNGGATQTLSTHALIEVRDVVTGPDRITDRITAMLPTTARDITGATLLVDGKTYKVISTATVMGAYQRAVLG